jgi:hypothetical protein
MAFHLIFVLDDHHKAELAAHSMEMLWDMQVMEVFILYQNGENIMAFLKLIHEYAVTIVCLMLNEIPGSQGVLRT